MISLVVLVLITLFVVLFPIWWKWPYTLRDKGAKLLGEAMGMPATDARNHTYAEAATVLTKAKAAYAAYCEKHKGDSSAEAEMVETSKMLFSAKKNKTL